MLDGVADFFQFGHPATQAIGWIFEVMQITKGMVVSHYHEMLAKQVVPGFLCAPNDGKGLQLCDGVVGFNQGQGTACISQNAFLMVESLVLDNTQTQQGGISMQ